MPIDRKPGVTIYRAEESADLVFRFPENLPIVELDRQDVRLPRQMKLADFYIVCPKEILIVEVKDPSHQRAPVKNRQRFIHRAKSEELIAEELTPKARESYVYLHLMERDDRPIKFLVLLALDAYPPEEQKAVLMTFKDRLLTRIRTESFEPWKRRHIADCFVFSVETWNQRFPKWPLLRLSQPGEGD